MRYEGAFSFSGPWFRARKLTVYIYRLWFRVILADQQQDYSSNLLESTPIKKQELDELEAYIREYRKSRS